MAYESLCGAHGTAEVPGPGFPSRTSMRRIWIPLGKGKLGKGKGHAQSAPPSIIAPSSGSEADVAAVQSMVAREVERGVSEHFATWQSQQLRIYQELMGRPLAPLSGPPGFTAEPGRRPEEVSISAGDTEDLNDADGSLEKAYDALVADRSSSSSGKVREDESPSAVKSQVVRSLAERHESAPLLDSAGAPATTTVLPAAPEHTSMPSESGHDSRTLLDHGRLSSLERKEAGESSGAPSGAAAAPSGSPLTSAAMPLGAKSPADELLSRIAYLEGKVQELLRQAEDKAKQLQKQIVSATEDAKSLFQAQIESLSIRLEAAERKQHDQEAHYIAMLGLSDKPIDAPPRVHEETGEASHVESPEPQRHTGQDCSALFNHALQSSPAREEAG